VISRRRFLGLGAAALGAGPPGQAGAHAALVRSVPARRSTLARPPERVLLWFGEPLEPAYSTVTVADPGGTRVDAGDARVGPGDPTLLSVTVPRLPPGTYTVRFRVLSVDGHIVESEFPFTVGPAPAPR
jgi:methionine-rich copper-binding protein CopC